MYLDESSPLLGTSLLCLGRQPSLYLPHPNIDIKLIVKLSPTQHPFPRNKSLLLNSIFLHLIHIFVEMWHHVPLYLGSMNRDHYQGDNSLRYVLQDL